MYERRILDLLFTYKAVHSPRHVTALKYIK